jgi:hypothetical protein
VPPLPETTSPASALATLPVLPRLIDNTAISTYMTCPREYLYSMVMHRRRAESRPALSFGSLIHLMLETHYRSDGNRNIVFSVMDSFWQGDPVGDYRTLARAKLLYDKYVKRYGTPSHEAAVGMGRTVGFPDEPLLELRTNVEVEGLLTPYTVKIDRVIDLGGLGYVEDHKSTSRLDSNYFRQFALSNQMKGYVAILRKLLPSANIVGVRINLFHVLKEKDDFQRHLQTYTKEDLTEWEQNTNRWLRRLRRSYRLLAKGRPDDGFPGHFGDNGCKRMYGMCQYFDVCSLTPSIRMRVLEKDFEVQPWNPLEYEGED